MRGSLVVLRRAEIESLANFVDYWEQLYTENKKWPDHEFLQHLKWSGGALTADDVRWLFRWKYRRVPNWSPEPTIRQLEVLNQLRFKETTTLIDLATELSPTGPVKRYFVCHIVSPLKFPIWDQYAFSAYLTVCGRDNELETIEDLLQDASEYESYRKDFNQWSLQVPEKIEQGVVFPPFRRLDRALWAMGDYIGVLKSTP